LLNTRKKKMVPQPSTPVGGRERTIKKSAGVNTGIKENGKDS